MQMIHPFIHLTNPVPLCCLHLNRWIADTVSPHPGIASTTMSLARLHHYHPDHHLARAASSTSSARPTRCKTAVAAATTRSSSLRHLAPRRSGVTLAHHSFSSLPTQKRSPTSQQQGGLETLSGLWNPRSFISTTTKWLTHHSLHHTPRHSRYLRASYSTLFQPLNTCARPHFPDMVISRRPYSSDSSDPSTLVGNSSKTDSTTPLTNKATQASVAATEQSHQHSHSHAHTHHSHGKGHGHDHAHSHSLFSSHVHDHSEGAGEILAALRGDKKDAGGRITLIGLASNIGLTATKGVAGIYMNSASLLAEAGHSLSDLLGDFVTLATWKLSRRPPSTEYPWGYGKFETVGTLAVSMILVGGAIGIGLHSYHVSTFSID